MPAHSLASLRCIATVFHQGGKAAWRAAWSGSLERLFQETIDQPVGSAAIGESKVAREIARR
jgi:hypothetical protein